MGRASLDIVIACVLCIVAGWVTGCDDTQTTEYPPPGLEVLTPRLGVAAGSRARILVRSNQPSRVSIYDTDVSIGTGRSGREITEIRFAVPDWVTSGVTATVQVIAVAEGGTVDTRDVVLDGLGDVESWSTPSNFSDIDAVGSTAVLLAPAGLWTLNRGGSSPIASTATGEFRAIVADPMENLMIAADRLALVSTYSVRIDGGLTLVDQFEFAVYDGSSPPEEVTDINALDVNGSLVAAATAEGMAILDRDPVGDGGEAFCRKRSAMTAKLEPAIYDQAMLAVVVTASERVVAGGAYLNVYEAEDAEDPGTCEASMPGRGTNVVAPPEDEQPWDIVALGLTSSFVWIGRRDNGVFRLPAAFETENHYLRQQDLWEVTPEDLPLPRVVDFAEGEADTLWVALSDVDDLSGGLALIGAEGVDLWVDTDAIGGVPRAIARSFDGEVGLLWILTDTGITCFAEP